MYVYHATHGNPGFYHDAARRVATVFENPNCLIKKTLPTSRRKTPYKRLTLSETFTETSLLEYGGLNLILPLLRGRSDAACRVVIRPSRRPSMGTDGLYHDAARHVATVFETWDCLIESYLHERRESPPIKD